MNFLSNVFLLIFILTPVILIVGMIKPDLMKKVIKTNSRGKIALACVSVFFISLIGFGVTSDTVEQAEPVELVEEVVAVEDLEKTNKDEKLETKKDNKDLELEQKYVSEVSEYTSNIGTYLNDLGTLMLDPQFFSDSWVIDVATNAGMIQFDAQNIIDMKEVPDKFTDVHEVLKDGVRSYSDSMDYLAQGIDNFDEQAINKATELINAGTDKVAEATTMLENK